MYSSLKYSVHAKLGGGLLADMTYTWKENSEQQSFAAWEKHKMLSKELHIPNIRQLKLYA